METNPYKLFSCATALWMGLDQFSSLMFETMVDREKAREIYARAGQVICDGTNVSEARRIEIGREAVQALEIADLSAKIALDRLRLFRFGLIEAPHGDLREARWKASHDQTIALLRWSSFRQNPPPGFDAIIRHAVKNGKHGFLGRLADSVKTPAEKFRLPGPDSGDKKDRLKWFLVTYWAVEVKVTKGFSPPLYTFKDAALLEYLDFLAKKPSENNGPHVLDAVLELDVRALRQVWERLGLKRPTKGIWVKAGASVSRRNLMRMGNKVTLFNYRP